MLKFLLGFINFGKIQLYLAIGTFLIGMLTIGYIGWKHQIEAAALSDYNRKQLEQVIQDQQDFQNKMRTIEDTQKSLSDSLARQNEVITKKFNSIDSFLSSPEAQKSNRPASEVLKKTIKKLAGE
jgi:uncharacterized protein with von Willebrand factor type A (vWA) domain